MRWADLLDETPDLQQVVAFLQEEEADEPVTRTASSA